MSGVTVVTLRDVQAEPPADAAAKVDFAQEVFPIFRERCFECHGPTKQKSGLRLDGRQAAFQGGNSGVVIVPAKSGESHLFQRISSTDPEERMPPKGEPLSARQIAIIQTWIDQGASWPENLGAGETQPKKHWAYVRPIRYAPPANRNAQWARTPIDNFILARLEHENLAPSPPADRATLIRRVSLDLIGLPPTLEQVDAFLADQSPEAYEKVVQRLLASPDYGVRWARPWLDLARYADTQGYEKDNRRSMWPYRDWVVNALNRNLPFDEFSIEQLAGDLLPGATQEQKVATGFHRNTMTNTEGGTDDEEFRHEAIVDRVNTTMSVWMGTTMACCQCHNHKYDPLAMKEYYQLYAFLNNTADADRDDEAPTMRVFAPGQAERLAELRQKLRTAEREFNEALERPAVASARTEWENRTRRALQSWRVVEPIAFTSAGGATLSKTADQDVLLSGKNPANDTYTVTAHAGAGRIYGFSLEVLPHEGLPHKSIGRDGAGRFVLTQFTVTAASADRPEEAERLVFQSAGADYSDPGFSVTNLITGSDRGWAAGGTAEKHPLAHTAYFALATPIDAATNTVLTFYLQHHSEWPEANLGHFRLLASFAEPVEPPLRIAAELRDIFLTAPDQRKEPQKQRLSEYYSSFSPVMKPLLGTLVAARKAEKAYFEAIPLTSVMEELPKPRETHILIRGSFLSKGERVEPGVPAIFPQPPTNQPLNRLTLARWLVDTNNPLTARVTVNRIWEQYFGHGIVDTVGDFGTQGEPPTHPELLDWLATEFMRTGWDLKALHKLIVTSAAYQQCSRVTPELLERDPDNRLLARGPRVRLEAELIRDQALAVAGLLSHKQGGPSVMPPQPDGLWQVVYSDDRWVTSPGEDKYRRALYTFWRRTTPYPLMAAFDAPTREYCVLRRGHSNTPLQALNTLNDPAFIEAAQALARRIANHPGDLDARLLYGFRLCLARPPSAAESQRLARLFETELTHYRNAAQAADDMATSQLGKPGNGADVAELAAWTVVANVLLNLDEMFTKG